MSSSRGLTGGPGQAAATREHCLARLYLRAVLPALPAFVRGDVAARRAVRAWRFAVRFASPSGVATTLAFRDGTPEIDPTRTGFALRLLFLSDRDVVRAFRRTGRPRVLPWGGLHHLARLSALAGLLARMDEVLNASPDETARQGWQALRVEILIGHLLPAAVAELGAHDPECRSALAPFGDFVAQVSAPPLASGWIARRDEALTSGSGAAPDAADLQLVFRDPEVALSAIDGQVDHLAASVTGEISVRGMIPLADAIARAMEKVSTLFGGDGS